MTPRTVSHGFAALAAGLMLAAPASAADKPTLTVYTYDSFVTDYGPGPVIEERFEATCGCDLNFLAAGDGAALLGRLKLEGAGSDADVVLGLDMNLMEAARSSGLIAPHGLGAIDTNLPRAWNDADFLPYDWGYFAFVGKKDGVAPANFQDLAAGSNSIVIQDPRSSTPGLGLLMWVKAAYGDRAAEIWEGLSDNIVTVTPGWSEAYGLFLEGEADYVLSYTTSPAYHIIAEGDDTKVALEFDEGHYMQVEVAGKLAASDQPDLASAFLDFLVSPEVQSVIPTTNWMYPSVTPDGGLPEGFSTLIQPKTALLVPPKEAQSVRDTALEEWRAALSK